MRDCIERLLVPARPALVPAVRRPAKALVPLGLLALVIPGLIFAGDRGPSRLDTRIRQAVVDSAPGGTWDIIRGLDWLGEPIGRGLLLLAISLVCLAVGRRALAITAVVSMVTVTVLAVALKPVVGRRIHAGFLSYPSGHTAALTAAALIIGLLLADVLNLGPIAGTAVMLGATVTGAAVTSWAQIVLDAHYPTDTIGGFGCALLVVPATASLIDRVGRRRVARPAS